MAFKIAPCYDICHDAKDCNNPFKICKREGFYLYDIASELWFDGKEWTPEKEKAKRYKTNAAILAAANKERERQKNVVAELSEKFGK